jgi:hypothetical protein
MSTVLVLLDAFRWDYLSEEHTPFLWERSREGLHVRMVRPSPGYCERSEILTGRPPAVTGNFTAIGFDPERSPYRGMSGTGLLHLAERGLRGLPRFHRHFRHMVGLRLRRRIGAGMPVYHIPFPFLPYFSLTEDRMDHAEEGAFAVPTILDRLRSSGGSFHLGSFTALNRPDGRSDEGRLASAVRAADEGHDLYLVYVASLDTLGHQYGPDSNQLTTGLRELDGRLRRFTKSFRERDPSAVMLFLGDHGMVPVTDYVDVGRPLLRAARVMGLVPGRDFVYFLDSTICRIWWFTDRAREGLTSWFESEPALLGSGTLLDEPLADRLRLPWGDRRYGDIVWLAREGRLIEPDFFHRGARVRGMHGYVPETDMNDGLLIACGEGVSPGVIDIMGLREVSDLILGVRERTGE